MTKPKVTTAKKEAGFLSCTTCKLSIPYAGFDGQDEDDRPKHRCVSDIQPFTTFSLKAPSSRIRSLPV